MQYYEIKISSPSEDVESLSNAMIMAGIDTFQVDDIEVAREILSSKKTFEWDYYDESLLEDHDACITIYTENDEGAEDTIARVRSAVRSAEETAPQGHRINLGIRLADDSEWKDEWKKYFQPVHLTDRIVIRPSWESYDAAPEEKVIEIDP